MTCAGAYALPWQFAAFWCISGYAAGIDRSGGIGNPSLLDTQINFVNMGVRANEGMILYNVTKGTEGPVTVVTATTLTATGVTWDDGDAYRIAALTGAEQATIQMYLDITAADIHAALAAMNSCNCTFQSWVTNYLAKINIIESAAFYNCPCAKPNLSDEQQASFIEWANTQLELLRTGELVVCEGDTGKNYPAFGWAEIAHTVWEEEQIAYNYRARNSP